MSNTFEDMTNAELKEACVDFGLEVIAKNPAKPNKTEYLEALATFKEAQDATHSDKNAEKEEAAKAVPVTDGSKRKPQSKSELMKLDLYMKERVIIHDQKDTQTKDSMLSISWGNRLLGGHTDWIDLSGEPQYVRRGALQNIKEAKATIQTPNGARGVTKVVKNRFIIVNVDGLTKEELDELASQQKMRNSKIA